MWVILTLYACAGVRTIGNPMVLQIAGTIVQIYKASKDVVMW